MNLSGMMTQCMPVRFALNSGDLLAHKPSEFSGRVRLLASKEGLANEVDDGNAESDKNLGTAARSLLVKEVSWVVTVVLVLPLSHGVNVLRCTEVRYT